MAFQGENEVKAAIASERQKYGNPMSDDECVNCMNSALWPYRDIGWGLNHKSWGDGIGQLVDIHGNHVDLCSHDTVVKKEPDGKQYIWDVFIGAGVQSTPTWNFLGQHTQTSRYFITPIEPHDPGVKVQLITKIGATCFCLVDLYEKARARCNDTVKHLKNDMGVEFLRIFMRKGTGNQGDYWLNEGGSFSCVRSDLRQLPVNLQREVFAYAKSNGLRLAPTVFADNLGMNMAQQDEFVRGFIEAARDYTDIFEYIEVFNEPYLYGGGHGGDIPTLKHHAKTLRAAFPTVKIALGTPQAVHQGGSLEQEVVDMACPEADLMTVHFSRGTNNPQIAPNLPAQAPQHRSNGEPIGPDSSVAQTKDANALANNFRYTNQMAYGWYVYHDDLLIRPRSGDCWNRPEWPEISSALYKCAWEEQNRTGTGGGGGGIIIVEPPKKTILESGERLLPGERLHSINGKFYCEYQHDGRFVGYGVGTGPIWAFGETHEPGEAAMQGDGNFVIYSKQNTPQWWTGTDGKVGSKAIMGDDGNFVLLLPTWSAFGGAV